MTEKTNKTVLGADCRITGDLTLDSDAVIMGQFRGTLHVSGVLELTDSAKVIGTIVAGAVRIAGTAEADVVAEDGVEMLAGAQLTGRMFTTRLSVTEGASFQGDLCVGPRAMEAAASLLQQVEAAAEPQQEEGAEPVAEAVAAAVEPEVRPQPEIAPASRAEQPEPEPEAQPMAVVSNSLNSILQRRRAKVLMGGARGNGNHTLASSAPAA